MACVTKKFRTSKVLLAPEPTRSDLGGSLGHLAWVSSKGGVACVRRRSLADRGAHGEADNPGFSNPGIRAELAACSAGGPIAHRPSARLRVFRDDFRRHLSSTDVGKSDTQQ